MALTPLQCQVERPDVGPGTVLAPQRGMDFRAPNHVPFEYLSDDDLQLVRALRLPTFGFPVESGGPNTLIRCMAWFVEGGRIEYVWSPVFPPDEQAAHILVWLRRRFRA